MDTAALIMTQDYEFWKMILSSPAIVTCTGVLAGAMLTLLVSILSNRYNVKMKNIELEFQEKSRKEERIFNLKNETYKNIIFSSEKLKDIVSKQKDIPRNDFAKISQFVGEFFIVLEEHLNFLLIYSNDSMYFYIFESKKTLKEIKEIMRKIEKFFAENAMNLDDIDTMEYDNISDELKELFKQLGMCFLKIEVIFEELLKKIRDDIKTHHA